MKIMAIVDRRGLPRMSQVLVDTPATAALMMTSPLCVAVPKPVTEKIRQK